MESRSRFAKKFFKLLEEDNVSFGALGGGVGFNPDNSANSSDFYAPGDARVPKSIFGGVLTRNGATKSTKRKRKKKRKIKVKIKKRKKKS